MLKGLITLFFLALPTICFGQEYQNLKHKADDCEEAYHKGNVQKLSSSILEYQNEIGRTEWKKEGDSQEHIGLLYKFKSDLAYLKSEYRKAVVLIDSAIYFSQYQPSETALNLHIEKAQSLFMLHEYDKAASSLCKVTEEGTDSIYSVYASAYALALAYTGRFRQATECMEECTQACFTRYLSPQQIRERNRRRAKIMVLEAESKGTDSNKAVELYRSYFKEQKGEIASKFKTMTSKEREGYWLTQRQFIVDCYRVEGAAPDLLYDVALFNKNLLLQFSAKNTEFKSCNWQDVRKGLPQNGAAIEFIQYRKDSSLYMSALVITKKAKAPSFVRIGKVDEILGMRLKNQMTVKDAISVDYRNAKNNLYSDSTLQEILWNREIKECLKGCTDVYFTADAFLHQLAIEYMYPGDIRFHRLTSTRSLCRGYSPVSLENASALICGDIDFQATVRNTIEPGNDNVAFESLSGKGITLYSLEGSRSEIDSIRAVRKTTADSILSDRFATEKAFREMTGDYKIIHISSHGYYNGHLEVPVEELKPNITDNTLSQSVIFFSGASANLNNSSFDPVGHDDELISARELSDMDMSNIDLCVLAACQTGLGDVTADGVYGIQRGLKNAGAGAMLLSLWSVSDKATAIMMTKLYEHLAMGEDIHTAFNNARKDLAQDRIVNVTRFSASTMSHKKSKKVINFSQPYYTNAFILIDDIR